MLEPLLFIEIGTSLLSWPKDKISCILSGQSEFNLRAKSSTSLHEKKQSKLWKIRKKAIK